MQRVFVVGFDQVIRDGFSQQRKPNNWIFISIRSDLRFFRIVKELSISILFTILSI